jgi:hypothetical protein
MKDFKLELLTLRKIYHMIQNDIFNIIESHLNACNVASEKQIILSLNESLKHIHMIQMLKVY